MWVCFKLEASERIEEIKLTELLIYNKSIMHLFQDFSVRMTWYDPLPLGLLSINISQSFN